MQCWSRIQQATNKFHGCFTQIENRQPSGVNEQDKILEDMYTDKKEEKIRKVDIVKKKYLSEMVEIEKRKIDLEHLREEDKIIQMDINGMPPHLQQYYYHRQMEIIEKRVNNS
ncbi:hypothetical protein Ddye_021077 [Dipteronia dyeriana]|uniref:No apical meristem-associated C-terminal domain-containing protein n=1 Tax=Dipteronia dyeriana TaxID=168575 RepID=A0AAD9U1J3_9ROSI|nr:hypothetical protein Ddye_021077 [Dipteronia dyeriana]